MTQNDVIFISKRIKLNKEKTQLLIEEPRDLDLVCAGLVSKKFTKKDYNGLSFPLYVKLVIFNHTKDKNFDISEKSAVAKIISDLFPKLNNRTNFAPFIKKITPKPNELGAKYFFVISSLFHDKVNCKDSEKDQIKYISAGLSCYHPTLCEHIGDWFKILRQLKSAGKFSVNIQEEKLQALQSCPRYNVPAPSMDAI